MKRKRYSEDQIIGILKQQEAGIRHRRSVSASTTILTRFWMPTPNPSFLRTADAIVKGAAQPQSLTSTPDFATLTP